MIEVKFGETLAPGIEDEAIEVEHLLAEPKNEYVSVDGVLCFDSGNQGKCSEVKDVSCRLGSGLKAKNGELDFTTTMEGEDDLNFGVLDGFLDEVDEIEDCQATDGLSSPCDDYLLDIEFGGKVSELACGPREGSRLGNSSSESLSPGFSGASNGAIGVSESSIETTTEPECKNNMQDQNVICKVHNVFISKCGCLTMVMGDMFQKSPASLEPQDVDELDNDREPAKKRNKSLVETTEVFAYLGQKRTRNPPTRYIEESSDPKSRYSRGRQKSSLPSSRDKHLKARSSDNHCHVRIRPMALVKDESISGASFQASLAVCTQRGHPKKEQSSSVWRAHPKKEQSSSVWRLSPKKQQSSSGDELESDEEYSTTESEDDSVTPKRTRKGIDRRKHQRMWTLSEVTSLVDGISEYGVGRWTDIKRLLFSSSYRTPIDLRDKWRNLLRASHAQKQNWREVKQNQKHASHPLPNSLLHRIRELAALHPYPKEREPSISHVTPPTTPISSKVSEVNRRGRNAQRKNCT